MFSIFLIIQKDSPLILLANITSFLIIVTLLPCTAHKLVSSKRPTRYASDDSCNASTAEL